jgi:predicted DNA-binding ArsR family transcriptional regulator
MKAIHLETNSEFNVVNIMGEKVHLRSFLTGKDKKVDYNLFKSDYRLAEDNEEVLPIIPNPLDEIQEAKERATEVMREAEESMKKPETTIIRIDFTEKKEKQPKEKKESTKEPKEPKAKKVSTGTATSLKDICDELKVDPTKARRILRKSDIEKPGGSWEWEDPQVIAKIKALLK